MPTENDTPDLTELPLQPTGSGVADAGIARMQAEIANADDADDADGGDPDRPTRTQA
jgi:hypothetical protein